MPYVMKCSVRLNLIDTINENENVEEDTVIILCVDCVDDSFKYCFWQLDFLFFISYSVSDFTYLWLFIFKFEMYFVILIHTSNCSSIGH